ncbi:type I secretion system permease/ATPase [Magnetofaba australis]|uniref:Putative ABC transporter n=1 Tax=Magnetofaba australis IT-1 TaxID=1434232 RepID=A0A1Y2K3Y3_9PROT|nr:type I secretion system permease/ATPase [Magnetofaba australis]OSM01824.1 putative ABC transporter [Magnetofaba australis IT-1]
MSPDAATDNAAASGWSLPQTEPESVADPLLAGLLLLARHWGRPATPQALCAGLPLEDGRLTPMLCLRAAERAGLAARWSQRDLDELESGYLPALLLLTERRAAVLTGWDENGQQAQLQWPEEAGGMRPMARAELEEIYSGRALLCAPLPERTAVPEADDDAPQRHWFWGALRRFWPLYAETAAASMMINLLALASPLFIMNVYDRVVPNQAMETLWVLAIGAALAFGFDFLLRTLRGYFLDLAGKRADLLMASKLAEQTLGLPLANLPPSTGGLARTLQDFEPLRDFFASATLATLIDLPFAILFVGVIWLLGGDIALIPALMIPLVILIGFLLQRPLARAARAAHSEAARKHAVLVEAIGGLETIKTLGAEGRMQRQWERSVSHAAQVGAKTRNIGSLAVHLALVAQQLSTIALVVMGVGRIAEGAMSMGALIACTILSGRALAPLAQIAGILTRFEQSSVSLEQLNRIMSLPNERPAERRYISRPALSGAIALENVRFAYPGQKFDALSDITLSIAPGERVGFLGRMGSGKSTLFRLLLGLYEPQAGAVRLDGADLRQIDPADARRQMGYAPQEPLLFVGSLRENIAWGAPQADDARVLHVAELAGVSQFAQRHPMGLEAPVGERGAGLSGGQRQAVSLARALIHDPPMLLLDEPTSSMDSASEAHVKRSIAALPPGRTLLLATHRASLLTLVDRLVILDEGRIIADGPKEQVLRQLQSGALPLSSANGAQPAVGGAA